LGDGALGSLDTPEDTAAPVAARSLALCGPGHRHVVTLRAALAHVAGGWALHTASAEPQDPVRGRSAEL